MDDHHRIRCAEIWGGAKQVDRDIITNPLRASLYSKPTDGDEGGDIYYFSVCGHDQLTRLAIADVQGHGHEVGHISEWLYELIRDSMDTLDARHVLTYLNDRVIRHGFEAMSTVALVSYYLGDSQLFYSYAGHPPIFLERRGVHTWTPMQLDYKSVPSNLPLGILEHTEYDQSVIQVASGDRVVLYSDGLTDVPDQTGNPRGDKWLRGHLDLHRDKTPAELKRSFQDALTEPSPLPDDVTVMVVEVH